MKITSGLVGFVAVLSIAACGGDDDEGSGNVTANTASASSAVTGVGSFTDSIRGADGAAAGGAVYALGASAQGILTYDASSARQVGGVRAATGTCECTESGCTFEACGDSTWTIDGTIGISGDTYTIDLDLAINAGGQAWDWAYDGEITATDTSIDGSLSGDGGGTFSNPQDGSEITLDWSWSVDYNEIELDASSCAVGGSLDAHVDYSAGTSQGGGNFSGSGHVDFGPTCGAATAS
jgi:hypothetical protein